MGLCGAGECVEVLTARAFGFDVLINAFENQFITVGAAYFFHLDCQLSLCDNSFSSRGVGHHRQAGSSVDSGGRCCYNNTFFAAFLIIHNGLMMF